MFLAIIYWDHGYIDKSLKINISIFVKAIDHIIKMRPSKKSPSSKKLTTSKSQQALFSLNSTPLDTLNIKDMTSIITFIENP